MKENVETFLVKIPCIIMILFIVLEYKVWAGVGESSVITLVFPPGARATGLGEAFTGLSDDANATFFNPAGLGQAPLANSWKAFLNNKDITFTAIVAKNKKEFSSKEIVWAATNKGLMRYNGKAWEAGETYLIEVDDDLHGIASKFLKTDNEKLINRAIQIIRTENKIGVKQYNALKVKLLFELNKEKIKNADSTASVIAEQLVNIPSEERSSAKIYGIISNVISSKRADALSDELNAVFLINDIELKKLVQLKIPFSIAITDSITSLALDHSERLWVGTTKGLWRYNESEWNSYTVLDGLPSNHISCITVGSYGEIAVGTDNGIATLTDGKWLSFDSSNGLPSSKITSLVFGKENVLYIGTQRGLVKKKDSTFTITDTSNGLLSNQVYALYYDSKNRLWIGGNNGVTLNTETSWKRYKFPDSRVTSFAEQHSGTVWIGTNKGAISYRNGKTKVDNQGNVVEMPPEWKSYHSKNALKGNVIQGITVNDNDVWVATDKAVNHYDIAEKQVFLFYEPLLPSLGLRELWHAYGAFVYPTEDWGTLGLTLNYINMGNNTMTNALGREIGTSRSWEGVFGLSYGLPIKENLSLGLNVKFVYSALAPGIGDNGEGVGTTFAIDASVLKRSFLLQKLDLGFMLQNMGPPIFYIDRENLNPIPFTLRLGLVYHIAQTSVHDLKVLFDMQREVVKNHFDNGGKPDPFWKAIYTDLISDDDETGLNEMQDINYSLGLEYWYANFLALRTGFLEDYIGERHELTFGFGLRYGTMNFDCSYIYSPEGFMKGILRLFDPNKEGSTGVRNGQWRTSFLFKF